MQNESTIETYETKKQKTSVFNLTSDLFAGKVFEDIGACQELCWILLRDENIILKNVKTQYVIRNLENHSVELDILAEETSGNLINVELQMYKEPAPFKRTRYYLSSIDMSIYLKNSDPFYQTENFPRIVERVHYFKIQKEGVTIMCEIADRIRQEGKAEGVIAGKIEAILELLEELGNIPKQLMQRINQETNLNILSKWLKCAAKASSFAEFEAKM